MATKPSLLLSACCGVCAAVALERLAPDYDITVLFYGDNLDSKTEYSKRLAALTTVNEKLNNNKEMIVVDYNHDNFIKNTAGLTDEPEGGKRCAVCFLLRLDISAEIAKTGGFGLFATTLTTSPHKNAEVINRIGAEAGLRHGIKYLPTDFKQNGGFTRSIELSKHFGIYRQKYCGCFPNI